jgi:hypothetical protein
VPKQYFRVYVLSVAAQITSESWDKINIDLTFDDDALSSAMGTETLVANDMVSEGMQASRNPLNLLMQRIGGVRYLRVEGQSVSRRSGSKVSKIW